MASLLWNAWPRISPAESQRLYKYFASHGSIVTYNSIKKVTGPSGQGIVVFADAEVGQKMLGSQETTKVDLAHLFDPDAATPDSATTDVSALSKPSKWSVSLMRLNKTPDQVSVDRQYDLRGLGQRQQQDNMSRFVQNELSSFKSFRGDTKRAVSDILESRLQTIIALQRLRKKEKNQMQAERRQARQAAEANGSQQAQKTADAK